MRCMPTTPDTCPPVHRFMRGQSAFPERMLAVFAQQVVDGFAEQEAEVKEYLINNLSKRDERGAVGKSYQATIVKKEIPRIADPTKFYAYMAKNKAWDMMQKRLNEAAVKDRLENARGGKLPGIEIFPALSVSLTKIK